MNEEKSEFVIFPPCEIFYMHGLLFCAESALRSAEQVSLALQKKVQSGIDLNTLETLDHLQNIANQCAAVSRYFWPADKKYNARGKELRAAFHVEDSSPLKDRKLRNMIEHFDEHLDEFLKESVAGQFIPEYVGPNPPDDRGPLKFFRAYFVNSGQFEILGESFYIQPLIDEMSELHQLICEADKDGSRFPRKSN